MLASILGSAKVDIASAETSNPAGNTAKIWTDKADYLPGTTVTIFGTGFLPNADVALNVTKIKDGTITSWSTRSDVNGNFTTTYQIDKVGAPLYTVIATDGTNTATKTFTDASPGLDGYDENNADASSCTLSITTTGTNDIIYAAAYVPHTTGTFSISDNTGTLTWHSRTSSDIVTSIGRMHVWYAISTAAITSKTITITQTVNNNHLGAMFVAFSGVNTNNPFDPSWTSAPPTPVSGTGTGNNVPLTFSVTDNNDVVVGFLMGDDFTPTAPATATNYQLIEYEHGHAVGTVSEDNSVTLSSGSVSPGFNVPNNDHFILVADAFASAPTTLDHFTFSTISSPQTAGNGFSVTVTAYDASGNVKTDFTGSVSLSESNGGTVSPVSLSIVSGGTVTGSVSVSKIGTGVTLGASGGGKSGTSGSFNVNPGALNHFTISVPGSATAGSSFGSVTVTAYDANNNVKTDYTGQVYFTSTDNHPATLPYTLSNKYTFTSGSGMDNGVHTFAGAGFTLFTAPSQTITVTDGSVAAVSSPITVVHAVGVASVSVSLSPTSVAAPATVTGSATAYDVYGNSWTVTGLVSWSITSGAGGSWSSNVYTSAKAGSWTVTADDGVAHTATVSLVVTADVLNSITVTPGSSSIVAGVAQTFSTEGFDQFGNDLGSVAAVYTVNSVVVTSQIEDLVGSYSVSASFGGKTATASWTVTADVLNSITVTPGSSSIVAGVAQTFSTEGFDQFGNDLGSVAAVYTVNSVVVTSQIEDLVGSYSVSASFGGKTATASWTVTDVAPTITAPGVVSVPVNALGGANGVSLGTPVVGSTAYAIGSLVVTNDAPSLFPLGSTTVTWTVTDPSGQTATATQTVTVTDAPLAMIVIAPGTVSVTAGYTQVYSTDGFDAYGNDLGSVVASYMVNTVPIVGNSVTENMVGSYSVEATYDGKTVSATLSVTAAGLDHIGVAESSSVAAGSAETFTVKSYDQYGNLIADVTSGSTFKIGVDTVTNPVTETAAGSYSVTVSHPVVSDVSASWTVTAAVLDHFDLSSVTDQTAGTAFSVTVTAKDAYGNTVTGYTGSPSLTVSAGSISPGTMNAFVNGVGTTTVTVTAAGSSVTLGVNDGSGHTGTSNSFTANSMATSLYLVLAAVIAAAAAIFSIFIAIAIKRRRQRVTAFAGANGAINPSGSVSVKYGDKQSFTITPDTGYHIVDVILDGVSQGAVSSYTFTNIQAAHMYSGFS